MRDKIFYVIVRAFGNKPERLQCKIRNGSLIVCREGLNEWIQISSEFIFEYEDSLFSQLKDSFNKKKDADLTKFWSRAKPFAV